MNVDKIFREQLFIAMMAKVATVFAVLLLALVLATRSYASPAAVGSIDSSASGVYVGWDRVCRIVLSRYQTHWVQADIRCQEFSGSQSASLTTIYAPDTCPQGGAYNLTPWLPATEYLSLRSFGLIGADAALAIVIGPNATDVSNGIGSAQNWIRLATLQAANPYTCGPSPKPEIDAQVLARFCRQHPAVPACLG
jgi:hypothetical protein